MILTKDRIHGVAGSLRVSNESGFLIVEYWLSSIPGPAMAVILGPMARKHLSQLASGIEKPPSSDLNAIAW
ncbi:MAG: hypothetical protein ACPGQT_04125, partial [Rhodothermales bacterium]